MDDDETLFVSFAGLSVVRSVHVAWVLAYSMEGIGRFYNRMQIFQRWFNRVVAVLFILVGIYYGLFEFMSF